MMGYAVVALLLGLSAPFALCRDGRSGAYPRLMVAGHLAGLTLAWIGVFGVAAALSGPGMGLWELCRLVAIRPSAALSPIATSSLLLLAVLVPWRAALHCARALHYSRRLRLRLAVVGAHGGVIEAPMRTVACTVGVVRAWVVVDPDRLALLATEQQQAVLAHERGHVKGLHGLIDLVAHCLAAGLVPWPGARLAVAEVRRHLEAAADDVAARRTDPRTVASAIVAVACQPAPALGMLGAAGWTLWRVDRLVASSAARPQVPPLAVGVLMVAGLVVAQAITHTLHGLSGMHPVVLSALCCM